MQTALHRLPCPQSILHYPTAGLIYYLAQYALYSPYMCTKHEPLMPADLLPIPRWEGNPSSNIRILNNTVTQCPYGPGVCCPAISVYAGGDDADARSPIMHNVEVRGNLVVGSLVGAEVH